VLNVMIPKNGKTIGEGKGGGGGGFHGDLMNAGRSLKLNHRHTEDRGAYDRHSWTKENEGCGNWGNLAQNLRRGKEEGKNWDKKTLHLGGEEGVGVGWSISGRREAELKESPKTRPLHK